MSGSESEALSAIVVNRSITISSPRGVNSAIKPNEGSKICSSCKLDKAMSEFVGTSTRHKGQEMRTCGECRTKNLRVPARRLKGPVPIVNRVAPRNPDNEVRCFFFWFSGCFPRVIHKCVCFGFWACFGCLVWPETGRVEALAAQTQGAGNCFHLSPGRAPLLLHCYHTSVKG